MMTKISPKLSNIVSRIRLFIKNYYQKQVVTVGHAICKKIFEVPMVALSSCEILEELRKLGVAPSELIDYVCEYTDYCCTVNEEELV